MASLPHHGHGKRQEYANTRLDLSLFSPQNLNTEEGLHNARVALDTSWWQDELEPLELTVMQFIAGPPNLLVYVVAIVLDEHRFDRFLCMLQSTFPSTAKTFTSSLASDLTNHLREFYIKYFLPDVPRSLDNCHRTVDLALNAFKALSELRLDFEPSSPTAHQPEMQGVKFRQPQRKNKHARHQSRSSSFTTDPALFLAFGVDVPSSEKEVANVEHEILAVQKATLEEYLNVLRLPAVVSSITKLYILSETPSVPQTASAEPFLAHRVVATVISKANKPSKDAPVSPEVYPAYPHIQPVKAAKYFSEPAKGFGHWQLFLSTRAIQHVKSFRRDENTRWGIIVKTMQQLSNGIFSDSNQKKLRGFDKGIPIYEAKIEGDLRLIYQIDLAPDDATGIDHQIIKIWGIHTHAQVDNRLWTSIAYHQSKIGGEYRRRCLYRETPKHPGSNVTFPASWTSNVEKLLSEDAHGDQHVPMTTEEQLELHSILALEKFTRMSQALMNSIVTGLDDTYTFELTGPEQEIRDHPSSCFVLGRSGTGKTTTMIFKMITREMLDIQQAAETKGPPVPKHRQLFVTQSRILARRVQDYFGKMLMSQSAGQKTSEDIKRLALRNLRKSEGDDMLDIDEDEGDERPDLPKKFSELEDNNFPLFLTVSQLCKLLEADFSLSFKRRSRTKEHRQAEQKYHTVEIDEDLAVLDDEDLAKDDSIMNRLTSSYRLTEEASIITFETFFYAYWPHFPQSLTKGLDPALVWNEFMGVIKGSEESLDDNEEFNFLDKVSYLNLSHRRQSTFARERERIYSIFESYVKLKRAREDYDAADRTHAILKALNGGVPGGRKVDFLYVDEAQDNLMVDACLLRQLCGNPHGLFWAGDTAQTISMGSSFRFNDLKAFLYRLEERSCFLRAPIQPASFELAINYRSHAGVVNCAHSVVELVAKFWPNSLDSLARERGVVDGPRPVFFCGWDSEACRYEQFLFHESGNIEFGAQQCILVRDDKAREDLRREIGEVGLIMTLYESKGLEFNDVLLFNFFADSTATLAEWRVIMNAIEESKRENVRVPQLDENRHASICSELKSLYVGITRARCHVWILDIPKHGEARGEPMRVFWESKNLVQTCRPGDPVPELAVRSTPEQWAQQGRTLFRSKHFQLAMSCFERAGLLLERWVSYAYLLRRTAYRIPLVPKQGANKKTAYLRAAEAFVVCVGLSYSIAPRTRYFCLAADCFVTAGAHAPAAQAYLGAERYTDAAQQFKHAKLFDEAADVVLQHPKRVDPVVAEQCLSIARLHLHREHQIKKAARLFDSIDDQLLYLEDYGFDIARITILQDLERWGDAAQIHYGEGRPLDAISLWIRANDPESRRCARMGLLNTLWITFPLGNEPDEKQFEHNRLFELLRTLSADLAEETGHNESEIFLAIFAKDHAKLLRLARELHYGHRKNSMGSLLCLDHALKKPPNMKDSDGKTIAKYLEDYDLYAQLMRKVIADSLQAHGEQWSQVAKLLGFTGANDGTATGESGGIHVLPTSILYESLKNVDTSFRSINEKFPVTLNQLSALIRQVLGQRLRERLSDEHDVCLHVKLFRPCLNFAIFGECGRTACSREHVPAKSSGVEAFNLRTRLHLQQILVVHDMQILSDHDGDRRKLRRIWQERLYETLFPSFYTFGDISALIKPRHASLSPDAAASRLWFSLIPEHQRASKVLSDWLQDRFYSLNPFRGEERFMTDAVQTAMLSFAIDRHNAAHHLYRADCVVKHRHPRLQRKDGYVVHDLLTFLEGSLEGSIANGVVFIKHVLDERIPIDANTLLNVLEAVIGRTIIGSCQSLHGITLPRSWIMKLLSNWDERCRISNRNQMNIYTLFKPLAIFMEGIWSNRGIDHILYEGRSLVTVRTNSLARTAMLFRICKCLALLGYNVRYTNLQREIGKTLTSLSTQGRNVPSLIAPYVKAEHWKDVARAVRSSTESDLDELIYLGKGDNLPKIYNPFGGIRLLRFNSMSEVLPSLEVTGSSLNPEAKSFVPSANTQQPPPLPDAEPIEDDSTAHESFRAETGTIEVVAPNDLSVERTEREIRSAEKIQVWYRRRIAMKSREIDVVTESRIRFIAASQAEVGKLQVSSPYRHMFLGPLPHILTALQGCHKALLDAKQVLKKLLRGKDLLDLEKVHRSMTKCNDLIKEWKRIWKGLELPAKLHNEGSVEKLKERVQVADEFVKNTLDVAPSVRDFLWDMEVGYKGIVRVARPPPPPPPTAKMMRRPSLNTEDIDD